MEFNSGFKGLNVSLILIFIDPCIVVLIVEITNKMQLCNRIYYSNVYWRLNMFRAPHRSSSGALNCICSLWFTYCNKVKDLLPYFSMYTFYLIAVRKPEAANTVRSSWWWKVCRSKHVEASINTGIINSITRLHLVRYFYWFKCVSSFCAVLISSPGHRHWYRD